MARNGGAAIRIVQPLDTTLRESPGFKDGRAVSWQVDMTKATNVDMVGSVAGSGADFGSAVCSGADYGSRISQEPPPSCHSATSHSLARTRCHVGAMLRPSSARPRGAKTASPKERLVRYSAPTTALITSGAVCDLPPNTPLVARR